jgi:hypothetical protein
MRRFHTGNRCAERENGEMFHLTRLPAPWTDRRPHPRIANQLARQTRCKFKFKILGSECQTSGTYAKRAKQATKKRQRSGLLVFSKLPSFPSAGSRLGCLQSSLGCEPRSLIRVSLGWFDYSKNVRKDNPTPAFSTTPASSTTPTGAN